MSKLLKKFILTFIIISFLVFIAIFLILWNYSNKLPDYKFLKNYKPPVSSKVYSGNGVLISDFSSEKRIFIPYNAIPKKIINSFLSSSEFRLELGNERVFTKINFESNKGFKSTQEYHFPGSQNRNKKFISTENLDYLYPNGHRMTNQMRWYKGSRERGLKSDIAA